MKQFEERMSRREGRSVFSTGETGRRMRPATVKTRLFAVRQAAAALVRSGYDPTTITSLRSLVDPVRNSGVILDYFHDRATARLPRDSGSRRSSADSSPSSPTPWRSSPGSMFRGTASLCPRQP
ncbi:hypothetical protein ACFQU2_33115 [Siccirubricoccus deserti]